jgi:hypothetical protein
MPQTKPKLDDSVSLFPFLDIMASLIGILVLLITAVTLSQIAPSEKDTANEQAVAQAEARVSQYRVARRTLTTDQRQKERLEKLLQDAQTASQQLAAIQAELETLQAQRNAIMQQQDSRQDQVTRLQTEAHQLEQKIKEAEAEIQQLQQKLAGLRKALAENEKPPPEADVQIMPSGSGDNRQPTFVECAGSSVVLHDGPEPKRIPVGQLASSRDFQQLLDTVKKQPNGSVVFLVRPDGASSYASARNIARRQYVTNGKLAVAGHGKLDLSLFKK